MILNWAFVECGQRPPESIDTSRPTEDSRQNGTTILLGRYMDAVINPLARVNGYTTITNTLPSTRALTMPYNQAWLQYHYNSGSNIIMHINSMSKPYSDYMNWEIQYLLNVCGQ